MNGQALIFDRRRLISNSKNRLFGSTVKQKKFGNIGKLKSSFWSRPFIEEDDTTVVVVSK